MFIRRSCADNTKLNCDSKDLIHSADAVDAASGNESLGRVIVATGSLGSTGEHSSAPVAPSSGDERLPHLSLDRRPPSITAPATAGVAIASTLSPGRRRLLANWRTRLGLDRTDDDKSKCEQLSTVMEPLSKRNIGGSAVPVAEGRVAPVDNNGGISRFGWSSGKKASRLAVSRSWFKMDSSSSEVQFVAPRVNEKGRHVIRSIPSDVTRRTREISSSGSVYQEKVAASVGSGLNSSGDIPSFPPALDKNVDDVNALQNASIRPQQVSPIIDGAVASDGHCRSEVWNERTMSPSVTEANTTTQHGLTVVSSLSSHPDTVDIRAASNGDKRQPTPVPVAAGSINSKLKSPCKHSQRGQGRSQGQQRLSQGQGQLESNPLHDMPARNRGKKARADAKINDSVIGRSTSETTPDVGNDLMREKHISSNHTDLRYNEPTEQFPFAVSDTILPPPELFDTETEHFVDAVDPVEEFGDAFILPPPEEFEVGPTVLPAPEETDNAEIVLPPPESFETNIYDAAPGSGQEFVTPALNSKLEIDRRSEFDQKRNPVECTQLVSNVPITSDGELKTSCDAGVRSSVLASSVVDRNLVIHKHGDVELYDATKSEVSAARKRLASDAMDKLDALCKTESSTKISTSQTSGGMASYNVSRKMPTFTSIPVYHETAALGSKAIRRRAVADSWPGGLFIRDQRQGVSVDEVANKRHSADNSTALLVAHASDSDKAKAFFVPQVNRPGSFAAAQPPPFCPISNVVLPASQRRLFLRRTGNSRVGLLLPNGSRLTMEGELRHKSLEPPNGRMLDDDVSANAEGLDLSPSNEQKRVIEVHSEGDLRAALTSRNAGRLSSTSPTSPTANSYGDQIVCSERVAKVLQTAAVRKNLLEQVSERRKGVYQMQQRRVIRATSAPSKGRLVISADQLPPSVTHTENYPPEIPSPGIHHSAENISSVEMQLVIEQDAEPLAQKSSEEIPLNVKAVSSLIEHIAETAFDASTAINQRLKTERSMETIYVERPASIVIPPSPNSKPILDNDVDSGSPVRVYVDGFQVSGNPSAPYGLSTSSSSLSPSSTPIFDKSSVLHVPSGFNDDDDDIPSSNSDEEDIAIPPPREPHVPLCYPESSSLDSSSELQSGRNTPSTSSLNAFSDFHNIGLSSPENTSAMTDSGVGMTSLLSQPQSERHFIVVAIDFGTTYSGYAFSFVRDPDSVHMMRRWEGGDPGVVNQKTPTTLLLEPNGQFHSFGFAARDFYHDLDAQDAKKWLFFEKFKMALHYNSELNKETTIKAANGRSHLALSVFSHALKFFYDHALQELSDQSATTIVNEDIRWVITVPAIWKAQAKQFMRLAAYQSFEIKPTMDHMRIFQLPNGHHIKVPTYCALMMLRDQCRFTTKRLPGFKHMSYITRCNNLNIERLNLRAGIASPETPSQLLIALEPEAASIYVRRLRLYQLVPEPPYVAQPKREPTPDPSFNYEQDDEFNSSDALKYRTLPAVHLTAPSSTTITVGHEVDIEGTRYMVVDCGGGTVDITVYEMESRYGCLKELHKATGGPYGSVGVDLEFEKLLVAIFGAEFIDTFKLKRPSGWVDLMSAFESRKRTASPFKTTPLNVALPFALIDYYKKSRIGSVENAVRKFSSREVTWSSQGMLRLTVEAMRRLFQPTLDRIKQAIGDILNHPNARDIRYMFLVGGFSESPMLQLEMRKEFSHLLKIIIPQDVALTILKGAVIFGIDPTVVGVRRSRLTYGVGVLHRFVRGKHPTSKKITRDGNAWCVDVFDRFVSIDQEVSVGDIVVRSYAPVRPGQRSSVIHIYCSDSSDVEYVTDPGVRRCGTLCLDLTDTLYHDPDPGSQNALKNRRRREIRARMTFGDTEIRVDAVDVATGRSVRAGIDFLSK